MQSTITNCMCNYISTDGLIPFSLCNKQARSVEVKYVKLDGQLVKLGSPYT